MWSSLIVGGIVLGCCISVVVIIAQKEEEPKQPFYAHPAAFGVFAVIVLAVAGLRRKRHRYIIENSQREEKITSMKQNENGVNEKEVLTVGP